MLLHELLSIDQLSSSPIILIIGSPASGKTHVASKIAELLPGHKLIHTDDYMEHGFEQSLYALMDDLAKEDGPIIIEGLLGYRLLRKGVELDSFYPDLVIDLQVSDEVISKTYNTERDPEKLKRINATIKACHTVLAKYELMDNDHRPRWITVDNNY